MSKRIITVQDLINQLLGVADKSVPVEIFVTRDGIDGITYSPDMFDYTVIDYTDVHPDDGEKENKVLIQLYR